MTVEELLYDILRNDRALGLTDETARALAADGAEALRTSNDVAWIEFQDALKAARAAQAEAERI